MGQILSPMLDKLWHANTPSSVQFKHEQMKDILPRAEFRGLYGHVWSYWQCWVTPGTYELNIVPVIRYRIGFFGPDIVNEQAARQLGLEPIVVKLPEKAIATPIDMWMERARIRRIEVRKDFVEVCLESELEAVTPWFVLEDQKNHLI